MPRTARASQGGYCYHVLNRGNARREVFLKDGDYRAFLAAITHAGEQVPMRLLAYCLMPNHFHLVVWPRRDGDLSRWMHWLLNAHVRRYHPPGSGPNAQAAGAGDFPPDPVRNEAGTSAFQCPERRFRRPSDPKTAKKGPTGRPTDRRAGPDFTSF